MLIKIRLTEDDWQQTMKDISGVEGEDKLQPAVLEERLEKLTQMLLASKELSAEQKDAFLKRLQEELGYIRLNNTERLLLENTQTALITKRYRKKNLHELTQGTLVSTPTGVFIDLEAYRELKRRAQHSARAKFNLTLIKIQYKLSDTLNWEGSAMLKLKALPAWKDENKFSSEQRVIQARIYLHLGLLWLQMYHEKEKRNHKDCFTFCKNAKDFFYLARESGDLTTAEAAQNYLNNLQQPIRWYGFEQERYQERRIIIQAILCLSLAVLLIAGFASVFIASHALWAPVLARFGLFLLNGLGTTGLPLIASSLGTLAVLCLGAALYFSLKAKLPKRSILFFKRQLRNFVWFFIPAKLIKGEEDSLRQQLEQKQDMLYERDCQITSLNRANTQLEQQLAGLETQLTASQVKVAELSRTAKEQNTTREQKLSTALEQAKAAEKAAQRENAKLEQQLVKLQTDYTKAQEQLASLQSQIKQAQELEQAANATILPLQQQIQELKQQLTASQQQLQAVASDNAALKRQLAELQSAQKLLIQEKTSALQQVEAAKQQHDQTQQQLAKLQLIEAEHKRQIKHLESVLHNRHQAKHQDAVKPDNKTEQAPQNYKQELNQAINELSVQTSYFEAAQQRALAAEQTAAHLSEENQRLAQQLANLHGLVQDKEQRITGLEQSLNQAHAYENRLGAALVQKLANPFSQSHAFQFPVLAGLTGHNLAPPLPATTGSTPTPPESPTPRR